MVNFFLIAYGTGLALQRKSLPLVVVEGEGPSMFGRDWLAYFKSNWHEIKSIRNKELSDILKRANVGELKGCKVRSERIKNIQ